MSETDYGRGYGRDTGTPDGHGRCACWGAEHRATPNVRNTFPFIKVYQPDGRLSPTDIYPPCCAQRINACKLKNKMKGKPPVIIEYIEWFRRNFSKYVLHILLLGSAYLNWQLFNKYHDLRVFSSIEIATLEERLVDYRGCRTQSPYGDPPLFVTFKDGESAYVNFFNFTWPLEGSAFNSAEYLDSYPQRSILVLNAIKSAVLSELEVVSFNYAREHRTELAKKVVERVESVTKEMEIEVYKFYFHEFCMVAE